MSDSILQKFTYGEQAVRTVARDGDPWFVASDVCAVLSINNSRQALSYLDDDEKGVTTNDTPGGAQSVSIINEPGLYSLVLRSRKAEAKVFKRWITHEVIPTIRKTGAYGVERSWQDMSLEEQSLHVITQQRDLLETQRRELTVVKPKAEAWDSLVGNSGSWSFNDSAKVLHEKNVIDIGEKRLVKWLVDSGYLYRDTKGRPHAYQRYIDQDLFTTKARTYRDLKTGEMRESSAPQVRITGKGLNMLRNRLVPQKELTSA